MTSKLMHYTEETKQRRCSVVKPHLRQVVTGLNHNYRFVSTETRWEKRRSVRYQVFQCRCCDKLLFKDVAQI